MRVSAVFLAAVLAMHPAIASADPIEHLRPSDGIASVRINAGVSETQIHVTFSDDMIPLGGGHGDFPVKLEGPRSCRWGWRGPRTISCLLGRNDRLPMAERYALKIEAGLTTVSGTPVPPFRLEFETDEPAVSLSNIDWKDPISPVIYVRTNVPVSVRELQRHIRLEPIGQPANPVRVTVTADPEPIEHISSDLQFALTPNANLAPDTAYVIRVADGLAGIESGLVGSPHDAGSLRTHADFEFLGVGCGPQADRSYWEHRQPIKIPAEPDCAPEQPISLLFSAEPEVRGLYQVLVDAGLAPDIAGTLEIRPITFERPTASYHQATKVIYGVRLIGFPAGQSHTVSLPADIQDRFGRQLEPAAAEFPTRNLVPAFLRMPTLDVVASGSGDVVEFITVNTDAVAARFNTNGTPSIVSLKLDTESPALNNPARAIVDVEEQLGKPWGVLVGEVGITPLALIDKSRLRGFPIQYAQSTGAILTPWDVIVAADGARPNQRYSIWVSSLATGDAVEGASVELVEQPAGGRERGALLAAAYWAGDVLGTAVTDNDGFAEVVPTQNPSRHAYPSMVRVRKGDVVVVLPIRSFQFRHHGYEVDGYGRSLGYSRISDLGEGKAVTWGVTDKPLYRSGETVRVKGYVRVRDDNRLTIPDRKNGWDLMCAAHWSELCADRTVNLDIYGSFETAIQLPETVLDGEYNISVQPGLGTLSFRVANYEPKPHRVTVEIAADRIVGDSPVPIKATTEYFAGGTLKGVDGQVLIETRSDRPPVPKPLLDKYHFGRDRWYWGRTRQTVIDAKFDDDGVLTGDFNLPENSPQTGTATVTVGALHEGGEWAFSDPMTVEFVRTSYSLGLNQEIDRVVAGEPYNSSVFLIDHSAEGSSDFSVVQTLEYPVSRYSERTPPLPEIASKCVVSVVASEPASCILTPTRLGRAVLRARLLRGDEELQNVERRVTVVQAKGMVAGRRLTDRLAIEQPDERLQAGQTAEIEIDVPYEEASVVFALRRSSVFDHWRQRLPKGRNTVRIPLTEQHAPGFTLTAIARPIGSKAGTSMGVVRVAVDSARVSPSLSVQSDRETYKAGDEVLLSVQSSAPGKTQLAVAVIDEAVLNLVPGIDDLFDPRGERLAALLEFWRDFGWWQLSRAMGSSVELGSQLEEILVQAQRSALDTNTHAMMLGSPAANAFTGNRGNRPELRYEFAEAAYFNPNVLTSENGEAEVRFRVPDNFGQWRVVVVGADVAGQVFANSTRFNVTSPLEVRADVPARLIEGDSIQLGASVLNRKSDASEVSLSILLEAGGVGVSESSTFSLGSMASAAAKLPIDSVAGEEITLTATATDFRDTDGLRVKAPIVKPVELRSWTSIAPLVLNETSRQPIQLPENAVADSTELRVVLDRSVVGDISQTFHYMNQLDHRSWEQILSRAVVATYSREWDQAGSNPLSNEQIRNLLLQGSNFQTASGGMSHFEPKEDLANDYLSAYTLLALDWIADRGFEVPAYRQRLASFVSERVNLGLHGRSFGRRVTDVPSRRNMTVMLAALTVAESGAAHQHDQFAHYLQLQVDKLSVDELAFALIAATNIGASSDLQASLSERLQAQLVETFDRIEISGGETRFGSRNELYCLILTALQQAEAFRPDTRALAKLVRGGYEFRDENTGFGNTHANAICTVALTRFRDEFEAPTEALSVTVFAGDVDQYSIELARDEDSQASEPVSLPVSGLNSSVDVSLTQGSQGFVSTNIRYVVDLGKEIERSHGYTIQRTYSVYRDSDWQPAGQGAQIEQGEWVRIELDIVSPVVRRFVAITDPTPAGLVPVDRSLVAAIPGGDASPARWWNAFNQQALSNEQSKFYAEWLSAGSHTVTYYAQARFAGEFTALPAKVESMYSDGVFATTNPARIFIVSRSGS